MEFEDKQNFINNNNSNKKNISNEHKYDVNDKSSTFLVERVNLAVYNWWSRIIMGQGLRGWSLMGLRRPPSLPGKVRQGGSLMVFLKNDCSAW